LPPRGIELRQEFVSTQGRDATKQHRWRHDAENLADERLFVGVEQEATPSVVGERGLRADECGLAVLRV